MSGWMPFSSAAASTNGLNAEPGWRWPSVAMLNSTRPSWRAAVLRPADHRLHLAVARLDRDQRARDRRAGLADAAEVARDRLLGLRLLGQVDRRVHLQAAGERRLLAVLALELLDDVVDEVRHPRRPWQTRA